jgi:Glycolipid transfer protein (GLTP)
LTPTPSLQSHSLHLISLSQSYAEVSTDPGVDTSDFLDATEGLVKLFDLLGSTAFSVVQNDMNGNIKVRGDEISGLA